MKNVLVYHPTGNQNVRALLRGLAENGLLQSFHTSVAVFSNSWYYPLLRGRQLSRFRRRTYPSLVRHRTRQYPLPELKRLAGMRKMRGQTLSSGYISRKIAHSVALYVEKNGGQIDGVLSYPGCALPIFEKAQHLGMRCVLEQTTLYYKHLRSITAAEKLRNPGWASTITLYEDSDERLAELDRELQMADSIIVPSSIIRDSLLKYGCPDDKIRLIPYGFPATREKQYRILQSTKLRLLYVGNLSQIKGLSYMFEAVEQLSDRVSLTIIGSLPGCGGEIVTPYLQRHHYLGTRPHAEILQAMQEHDLLLFPTLCDGYGLVLTEAMSQGTPVVATANCCAADIIRHGHNGWLVPIADTQAIITLLEEILRHPATVAQVGRQALLTASRRPWTMYQQEVADHLSSLR